MDAIPHNGESHLAALDRAARCDPAVPRDRHDRPVLCIQGSVVESRTHRGAFVTGTIATDSADGSPSHHLRFKGTMQVEPGGVYAFEGVREVHETFGEAFAVRGYTPVRPVSVEGIRRYLCGERFSGIGRKRALAIVEVLGDQTLEVLEAPDAVDRLCAIDGIGPKTAAALVEACAEAAGTAKRDVLPMLYRYGLTAYQAGKVLAALGNRAAEVLADDPYRLAYEVDGIGFLTADRVALRAGLDMSDPRRARAASLHALETAAEQGGHTRVEAATLGRSVQRDLRIDAAVAIRGAEDLAARSDSPVVRCRHDGLEAAEGGWFALRRMHAAEERITAFVHAAIVGGSAGSAYDESAAAIARDLGCTAEQVAAVARLVNARLAILTGGPGTGKSFSLGAMLRAWEARDLHVELAAPTGKAAVRMAEATGCQARTIHRLLEYHPFEGFRRHEDAPLSCGVVVIDESSMVDVPLMAALVRAIDPRTTQLVLVGDVDQIPSVGPGCVLRDLLRSGLVPVARLRTIQRQAAGSAIVRHAHGLLAGALPLADPDATDWREWRFDDDTEAEQIADALVVVVTRWIPSRLDGVNAVDDVQVLTPTHRGPLGTEALNRRIQLAINPPAPDKAEVRIGAGEHAAVLRRGDRVIHRHNNYKLGVFNGETGVIRGIEGEGKHAALTVQLDGTRAVRYGAEDLADLGLAYAITIHRSQGSEFPVVVLPVHRSHHFMMSRQLYYTGITRARRMMITMSTLDGWRRIVKNASASQRDTCMGAMLRRGVAVADAEGPADPITPVRPIEEEDDVRW